MGKQNWSWHSSTTTPRVAKSYLLQNPRACLLKHKGKFQSMHHLFAPIDYFPINREPLAYLMDMLFYSILPRIWSFISLLLLRTPQGVLTWFLGRCLLHHLSPHSAAFAICYFPLWVRKHYFNSYFGYVSSEYFIYSLIIIIDYTHFDFIAKEYIYNKYSK